MPAAERASAHVTSECPLSDEQASRYRMDGYVVVRGLIPVELVAAVRTIILAIEGGDRDGWSEEDCKIHDHRHLREGRGDDYVISLTKPAQRSAPFAAIAHHPRLRAAMGRLIGEPCALFTDQCGIKSRHNRSEQGGRTFYHQDSYYWRIPPELGCNCWIPLQPVGRDASALAFIPGSHLGWRLEEHEQYLDDPPNVVRGLPVKRKRIPAKRVDASAEALLPMQPGDAVLFTNYTWHRSEPNRSGETKAFYGIAYSRAEAQGP
jgi:ectoine hydroxylase-related dioxygenase (phytanoyl-CoA dioxygenase family)